VRIALDYDDTFTRDPELWSAFVKMAQTRGHEVMIVTMRDPREPVAEDMPCEVIYTGHKAKKKFLERWDITIDVWIDDSPHWILMNAAA
jgi:hypothetical protein